MHLEVSNKHCPLCKRPVATGDHPDPTRLCEECRSLLYTIMPRAGSNSFATADQAHASGQPSLVNSGLLAAPVPFDEGLSDTHFNSQEHQTEFASFNPVTDFEEVHVAPGVETEYFDDFETDDETYVSVEPLSDPIDETRDRPVEPRVAMPQVFLVAEPPDGFQNKPATLEARPPDETIKLNLLQAEEPAHLISLPHNMQANKETETISEIGTASEQEAADPWDDPLPSWEYSRNEYPLYVGVSDRKRIRKLRTLLVPAALILCLVAAYLVFQSRASVPQNQNSEVSSEQSKVESALPVAPTQATDEAKPASDDDKKAGAEEAEGEKAGVEKASTTPSDAPANAPAQTQWRHALQALASSSEDEANLFASKLVRAGIPAYVVPADIERRGKWYRVRVGGFGTAQEAQKFIAEARLRAKAAGINLKDLNVVDYEKP